MHRYVSALLQRLQDSQEKSETPIDDISHKSPPRISPASVKKSLSTSRYIGPLSCLSQSLSIIENPATKALQIPSPPPLHLRRDSEFAIDHTTHQYLMQKYFSEVHPLYPFVDETLPFLSPDWEIENANNTLNPRESFILESIYSISSHLVVGESKNHEQAESYLKFSKQCYCQGLKAFEKAATDISLQTLQVVTLAALHSLFSPQHGNFGQLIGLAARLAIDLGIRNRPRSDENEDNKINQVYMSVYCLENQYATAMDRPTLLPDPIIDMQSTDPHDFLCALYGIQSRFRSHPENVEVETLLREVEARLDAVEQIPIAPRHTIIAVAFETRLLIQDNDEGSAVRLIETYSQISYIRTSLCPLWAYRAGSIVASKISRQHYEHVSSENPAHQFNQNHQAYINCSLILDQMSRRWPSANALKVSLQSFAQAKTIGSGSD